MNSVGRSVGRSVGIFTPSSHSYYPNSPKVIPSPQPHPSKKSNHLSRLQPEYSPLSSPSVPLSSPFPTSAHQQSKPDLILSSPGVGRSVSMLSSSPDRLWSSGPMCRGHPRHSGGGSSLPSQGSAPGLTSPTLRVGFCIRLPMQSRPFRCVLVWKY